MMIGMADAAILVVDDDAPIRRMLERTLAAEGYAVESAADGGDALVSIERSTPDLILLDVTMPGLDGLTVCRRVRDRGLATPVLLLTARDELVDRVAGLDAGADDYVVKPFETVELLARVRALLRRGQAPEAVLSLGDLTLDLETRAVKRGGRVVTLSEREADLLELLLRNARRVVSREQALSQIWGGGANANVVDRYVRTCGASSVSLSSSTPCAGSGSCSADESPGPGDSRGCDRDARRGDRPRTGRRHPRRPRPAPRPRPQPPHAGSRDGSTGRFGADARDDARCARFPGRRDTGDGRGRRQAGPDRRPLVVARRPRLAARPRLRGDRPWAWGIHDCHLRRSHPACVRRAARLLRRPCRRRRRDRGRGDRRRGGHDLDAARTHVRSSADGRAGRCRCRRRADAWRAATARSALARRGRDRTDR